MGRMPRTARWLGLALISLTGGVAVTAKDLTYIPGVSLPVFNPSIPPAARARIVETYGQRPLAFEVNQGQADSKVKFLARGDGYRLFLTPAEAVLALERPNTSSRALRMHWAGANPAVRISGRQEQSGKIHYLQGNDPSKWRRNIPTYATVHYEGIYPGIDLVFYGNQGRLEHDYAVAPGADPRNIHLLFAGADRVEIAPSGELVLHTGEEEVRLQRPIAYQDTKTGRKVVSAKYQLIAKGGPGLPEVGFTVGSYSPATTLIIDPVLVYSTYLGGGYIDFVLAVAADSAGNAYLTGGTLSLNFPLTPDARQRFTGAGDAFLTKLDRSGALVYSTYLGGGGTDWAEDITLDAEGCLVVTGTTSSPDFPQVKPLPTPRGDLDAFVVKLDPNGFSILFSTLLGGSRTDYGTGVAVDPAGPIYLTGMTNSPDFPTVSPLQPTLRGDFDLFVAKITSDGSSLAYSTYLGGSGQDRSTGIATDSAGNPYVAGDTSSPNFPTLRAVQSFLKGVADAFVLKLSSAGPSLVYSTYLGGIGSARANAIAVDPSGNAYLTGLTLGAGFPTLNPLEPDGEHGGFVTKLSPAGELVYSSYLGTSGYVELMGIAVDGSGAATVAGVTTSFNYPIEDPLQAECARSLEIYCSGDVVVTRLNPQGSAITFSTYLGGMRWDVAQDVALDPKGNIYIGGTSSSEDFPTVAAFQPTHSGRIDVEDGFVAKIAFNHPPDCTAAFANPPALWPPDGRLVPIAIQSVIDPDDDPVVLTVTGVRQDEPPRGAPDATGIGTSVVSLRADRDGNGDGRVYRLSFTATDLQGASCNGTVKICVPHDQGQGQTCVDGGSLFSAAGR